MKLIAKIEIDHFRSIRNATIEDLGDFTAFAGLNNSGKSNILRAFNAFFNGQTDPGVAVDYSQDYYCHDLTSKKAKQFSITVKFDLPESFKFRKKLEAVETLLGRSFTLKKLWTRANPEPRYYLNDSHGELNPEQRILVKQFLDLISFRYIPNRVLPLDIIRGEHKALRDVLVRRLAARASQQQEAIFEAIGRTSETLIQSLQSAVHNACPDIGSIRLSTPLSWKDFIFAFGYKLKMNNSELDDTVQGSGIQSLLMLETLSLIDRDYFQKFGWRQAAIWAVEEPESSLHTSLEAKVADYLAKISSDAKYRLQTFCTTHSDVMLQSANSSFFVTMTDGKSAFELCDKKTVLEKAARQGISRWTHPILHDPLNPIILVEGKYDHTFLDQALKIVAPQKNINVSYLELLQGGSVTGGDTEVLKYIKANVNAIKTRYKGAPLIVLLDWENAKKEQEFKRLLTGDDPYKVLSWPNSAFNPKLDKSFRGIERHMPDRIIDAASAVSNVLGTKRNGIKMVSSEDYGDFKKAVFDVVMQGITADDLIHAKTFLQSLLAELR